MPELPEVETVRRGLSELIIGKVVKAEAHDTAKGFPNTPDDVSRFLLGATITDVRRRAKVLMIDLSTEYSLIIHLKMTGQLVFVGETRFGAGHPNDSLVNDLPDKSTRVTLTFTDGAKLFFNDQRKFGWMHGADWIVSCIRCLTIVSESTVFRPSQEKCCNIKSQPFWRDD